MNHRGKKSIFWRSLTYFFILGIVLSLASSAEAYTPVPFLGNWNAVDVDGSAMRLNIGGPAQGPFRITWVDDYMTFCSGEPGIIRGTGMINESNINLLEADLVAECFTSGDALAFHMTFRYHPLTRTLSSQYENGRVIIWRRSGVAPELPFLGLRVNYGDDWVESFYEEGHTVWVTVTESDGWTVKATAEVFTAPREDWGGEPGFQTTPENWIPEMPDIQPRDWVYGWVDNGASAQVQIGEISGKISLGGDFIVGTILAPWFSSELEMECHPWGAPPEDGVEMKYDQVYPNGEDTYTCSWAGEWDIQPGQTVGVGYSGPDGHWVANTFARDPRIVASESGNWFWTAGFNPGMLDMAIYASADEGAELLWSGQAETNGDGFTFVGGEVHGLDLVEGNYLVISDGFNTKEIVLLPISITVFDTEKEIMAGYAPADSVVWAAAGPMEWQERLMATADNETGYWEADFTSIGFDILEEYRESSFAQIFDEDGDANEGSTPPPPPPAPVFQVFPVDERIEGWNWPEDAYVHMTIDDPATGANPDYEAYTYVEGTPWDPSTLWVVFYISPDNYDVKTGDVVVLEDGTTTRTHTVQNLALGWIDVYDDTVTGTADAFTDVLVWPHGWGEMVFTADASGDWLAELEPMGIDLEFGMTLRAEIRDGEGNATTIDRNVFDPHFTIFPEWDWYDAMDWQDSALVTITVVGREIPCTATVESWGNFFNGGFPEGCDVVIGDTVRMTDGDTTREHVVQNLAVTGWDVDLDTLTGIADEGKQVVVWPHEHDYAMQTPTAEPGDTWTANFTGVFDLDYYQGGRAMIYGDMGNATAVDWYTRNPHFTIFPEWDWYDAMDWPDGATVYITVDDKEDDCYAEHISWGYFFNGGFPEECDVVVGDTVRMTDGNTTRVHEVENLAITGWDVFNDTLSGIAEEGAQISVWVHEHDESYVETAAGPGNTWTADFAGVFFDLDYMMGGRSIIYGEMGNATAVDWGIPEAPHIWIWIEWNNVDGHGWGLYEDVTLTINEGEHVLTQNTGYGTSLSFDVGAVGHDIVPGDVIVMSNGVVSKEMVVPLLVITDYDLEANTVSGTGDPGLFFFTYVDGQEALAVTWTDDTWVALFAELLEEQWGDAVQMDGDNDAAAATIHTVGE